MEKTVMLEMLHVQNKAVHYSVYALDRLLCAVCAELELSGDPEAEAVAAELDNLKNDTDALFKHVAAIKTALAELAR